MSRGSLRPSRNCRPVRAGMGLLPAARGRLCVDRQMRSGRARGGWSAQSAQQQSEVCSKGAVELRPVEISAEQTAQVKVVDREKAASRRDERARRVYFPIVLRGLDEQRQA